MPDCTGAHDTPREAVQALLEVEPLSGTIWEPACGAGSIVKVLCGAGHPVYATDLVDYGCPDSEHGADFLMERHPSFHVGAVVTNPPYKLADKFVRHALTLRIPKVIMLLRLAFYESECRCDILDGGLLARVHAFRNRLPMMRRAGWDGPKASSGGIAFAWFAWELGHWGPTALHRISWGRGDDCSSPMKTSYRGFRVRKVYMAGPVLEERADQSEFGENQYHVVVHWRADCLDFEGDVRSRVLEVGHRSGATIYAGPTIFEDHGAGCEELAERCLGEVAQADVLFAIIVETANRFARDLMVQEVGFAMLRNLGIALIAADSPRPFWTTVPRRN